MPRYKARLVVKGYEQVKGVDFDETYAPVGKLTLLYAIGGLSLPHYLLNFIVQSGCRYCIL